MNLETMDEIKEAIQALSPYDRSRILCWLQERVQIERMNDALLIAQDIALEDERH